MSSTKDQFTLMEIDIKLNIKYFAAISVKDRIPQDLAGPHHFLEPLYEGIEWDAKDECTIMTCMIPKIFPVFWGVDV